MILQFFKIFILDYSTNHLQLQMPIFFLCFQHFGLNSPAFVIKSFIFILEGMQNKCTQSFGSSVHGI